MGQRLEPGRAVLACRAVEFGLHAGEQLLVNGASEATGGLLVASAVLHGAQVIATAGPASRQRVAALGADHVIDYHDPDWPGQEVEQDALPRLPGG